MSSLLLPDRTIVMAKALKVPVPGSPGRYRAAKRTVGGRPRAVLNTCAGCCDDGGGGGGETDPRCCALPGQVGSRASGPLPNSFAAGPVSVSFNMTFTSVEIAEPGFQTWLTRTTVLTMNHSRVQANPTYVENEPDRFVCSTLPFSPTNFTAQTVETRTLPGGGTSESTNPRTWRYSASVIYGYYQNGWSGQIGFQLGIQNQPVVWAISARVGSIQSGSGATRPNTIPLPFLSQSPAFNVSINYVDNPQQLAFAVADGDSRTFFPQGTGVTQVTESFNVNLQVSGGPFAPCTGGLASGRGCSGCGESGAGTGGALI